MRTQIRVEHLSKQYRLGVFNYGTLYKDLQSWIARKRGKTDPHAKIGQDDPEGRADYFWALRDVNLEVEEGTRLGIIGRNGAGKSTLLRILSRITAPSHGRIMIRGRVASLLEVGTGFHPELTGRENIYLNGAILGMKKREVTRKLDEIIAFSEISRFIDTPVKRYSSGMYVRLAFAVAAHLDSDVLIADEVLAVGDRSFQRKCLQKMQDVNRTEGRTILFVSHNLDAIGNLCSKGVFLDRGSVVSIGDSRTIIQQYVDSFEPSGGTVDLERAARVVSSGVLRITDFSLRTQPTHGTPSTIEIRFGFQTLTALQRMWFGINIAEASGLVVCNINSIDSGRFHSCREGLYFCEASAEARILPGRYFVSLAVANGNQTVHYVEKICMLEIEAEGGAQREEDTVYRREGFVNSGSNWAIGRR